MQTKLALFWKNSYKDKNIDKGFCKDFDLLEKAKSGDDEAFCQLVKKYENFVYRTALFTAKNPDDAWDISQEVFIRVYKALDSFRCDSEFSTWLYRVCRNTTYDFLRKNFKNKTVSLSDMTPDEDNPDYDIPDTSDESSPEASLEKSEIKRLVREAISKLTAEHSEILIMRDIEGFTYTEISQILSIEEGTVKSRLSRARQALKKYLDDKNLL